MEPETGIEPVPYPNRTGLQGLFQEELRRGREGLESSSTVAHPGRNGRAATKNMPSEPETGIEPVTYALRVRRSTD